LFFIFFSNFSTSLDTLIFYILNVYYSIIFSIQFLLFVNIFLFCFFVIIIIYYYYYYYLLYYYYYFFVSWFPFTYILFLIIYKLFYLLLFLLFAFISFIIYNLLRIFLYKHSLFFFSFSLLSFLLDEHHILYFIQCVCSLAMLINFHINVLEALQVTWRSLVSYFLRFLPVIIYPVYIVLPCSSPDLFYLQYFESHRCCKYLRCEFYSAEYCQ